MAKKEYIQAKNTIESLMHEKCTCEFCKSPYGAVWGAAFELEKVWSEGNNREWIDFKPTKESEVVLADCYDRTEKAIQIALEINTVEFFDYFLGKVNICKNFKTYNTNYIWSEKKFFNISTENYKKHFTDRLLVALVNISPKGSQAYQARQNISSFIRRSKVELTVLSFAGSLRDINGARACVIDFKHINNFTKIERLELYHLKDWKNSIELKKLKKLSHIAIEGNSHSQTFKYQDIRKIETLITEELPKLEKLKTFNIVTIANIDLAFLRLNEHLEVISLRWCPNLSSLNSIKNMSNLREIYIGECKNVEDISALSNCSKLEKIIIYSGCNKIDPDIKSGQPITLDTTKKIQQYLNKVI